MIEVVSGDHLARMQEVIQLIQSAKLHDAEHVIETMIAGTAAPGLTDSEMHLRLAASSAAVASGACHSSLGALLGGDFVVRGGRNDRGGP